MKTSIIRVGNSRGIRIPKSFIEDANLGENVELKLGKDKIIIERIKPLANEEVLISEKALSEWLNEDEENAWKSL